MGCRSRSRSEHLSLSWYSVFGASVSGTLHHDVWLWHITCFCGMSAHDDYSCADLMKCVNCSSQHLSRSRSCPLYISNRKYVPGSEFSSIAGANYLTDLGDLRDLIDLQHQAWRASFSGISIPFRLYFALL